MSNWNFLRIFAENYPLMNDLNRIDISQDDELLHLLDEILGDRRKHYAIKKQVSYDCPICSGEKGIEHDYKGNFEVNYGKGVYKCWACGETHNTKGSISRLIKKFGDNHQYTRFKALNIAFDYTNIVENLEIKIMELPEDCVPLSTDDGKKRGQLGYEYLKSRGITDDIIDTYNLFYVYGGKYKNRILIPSFNIFDELEFFVTRSIFKNKLKYLNPSANKLAIIFNESLIDWTSPITLVEGPFDHLVVPNSIPLLGKKFYEVLFKKIYKNAESKIFVALDGDAYEDAVNIYRTLDVGKLKGRIYIVPIPKPTDISEIFQKEGLEGLKGVFRKAYRLKEL